MYLSRAALLEQFEKFLSQKVGLAFPPNRWSDLEAALERVVLETGISSLEALAASLIDKADAQVLEALVRHLTVGETYFFRDEAVFRVLEESILPELIRARETGGRRLRLWSAGCCTGEEAYSIAISVQKVLARRGGWNANILATDLNPDFLKRAAEGRYGKWSFRALPFNIPERYLVRTEDGGGYVTREIKQMVTFHAHNLAGDEGGSSPRAEETPFDVIFCRNVLMYFSAEQATTALERLITKLAPDGWLILGPVDFSIRPPKQGMERPFDGLSIYRKRIPADCKIEPSKNATVFSSASAAPQVQVPSSDPAGTAVGLVVPSKSSTPMPEPAPPEETQRLLQTARSLADQGKMQAAMEYCDRAIATNRMNPGAHYLRGIILQEQRDYSEAEQAYQRCLYLDPDMIVAHYAYGNLERSRGRQDKAEAHFRNAHAIASKRPPAEKLPQGDGLTCGRLVQIIEDFLYGKPL